MLPGGWRLVTGHRTPVVLSVLVVVAVTSALLRVGAHAYLELPDRDTWVASDPDSFYHMRRVLRVFEEGLPVAVRDDFMNYPEGTTVQWPPGYTLLVAGLLAPWAPEDPRALHRWVEHGTASLPLVWGVLTSLLVALAGLALAGPAAALVAGLVHACNLASINYSALGNGDHHAFVSLLVVALLWTLSAALCRGALDSWRRAARWGAAAGLLMGALLVTWVGSLAFLLIVDGVLGWLLVVHARRAQPGLPVLGLCLHGVALLCVLPAVLASPWAQSTPFGSLGLTWLHPSALGLGGVIFLGAALLRPGSGAVRLYPWLAAAGLMLVALFLALSDAGPARGFREGWQIVSEGFGMSIQESQPLLGGAVALGTFFSTLGYGVLLLPWAWVAAAREGALRRRPELLPWVVGLIVLGGMAVQQWRFAEGLAVPTAVLLGWGAGRLLQGPGPGARLRAWPGWALGAAGVLLVAGAHASSVTAVWQRVSGADRAAARRQATRTAARMMAEWLRDHSPVPPHYGVLALWGRGHLIEWAAQRPTVATNFGRYAGEEGFRLPARFFLSEDPAEAEALLARRQVRYVFVSSQLGLRVPDLVQMAGSAVAGRYVPDGSGTAMRLLPAWYGTMGARLSAGPQSPRSDRRKAPPPPDFLRLVHRSPVRLRGRPYGWIYERVPGAMLEARLDPGAVLSVRIEVDYPGKRLPLVFEARAQADDQGLARVRVPYCTEGANGDGRAQGPASVTVGRSSVDMPISEQDVFLGRVVAVGLP